MRQFRWFPEDYTKFLNWNIGVQTLSAGAFGAAVQVVREYYSFSVHEPSFWAETTVRSLIGSFCGVLVGLCMAIAVSVLVAPLITQFQNKALPRFIPCAFAMAVTLAFTGYETVHFLNQVFIPRAHEWRLEILGVINVAVCTGATFVAMWHALSPYCRVETWGDYEFRQGRVANGDVISWQLEPELFNADRAQIERIQQRRRMRDSHIQRRALML